ncbi:ABC transporter substrate-binding protein [Fontivita pretiosa]|uniref:ABC transporter substrate-binding protein n=1 Tax=Fontivita pretiosa TaxID=2989684 RepID=UPI003D17BB2E
MAFRFAICDLRSAIWPALLLLMVIGGCDRRAPGEALQEVRLGYFANATHAQAVLGVDSGEFAQAIAPVSLKTKVFNAGPSLIEALFAGEIDIGYIGPGPVLSAHQRSRGRGVRVISGAAANGVVIVARRDSGIKSMTDLKGRRIATPQHGNTQDIAARRFVTEVLGQQDHRNVLPVPNAEQSSMMSRGQIDAAWAPEPWGARLVAEAGATVIAEEKDLWPDGEFSLTVVITTPEFLHDHPEMIQQMLEVHRRWTQRLNADPLGTLPQLESALFKLTNKKLPPGVLAAAMPRIRFTDDPLPNTFRTLGQWVYDLGYSLYPPRLDNLFVPAGGKHALP